jgi:hypothetical protein
MAFSLFESKSSSSTNTTTTEVNSRNRSLASSANYNNSNNLTIGLGTEGDPFAVPGDTVKITGIIILGAVLAIGVVVYLWRKT